MPRNSAGSYSLPNPPFQTLTTISSSTVNSNFSDLGAEVQDSLSRSGEGGMLAPLRGQDGTAAAPAFSFTSENGLGLYRAGAGDVRMAFSAANLMKWSNTEVRCYKAAFFEDAVTVATGLSVTAGGATAVGATPAQGGVVGANALEASGALSTTSGQGHAISTLAKATTAGPNVIRLNARTQNSGSVTTWDQVRYGLSYDVDGVVGSGGSFYLSKTGARLAGGTAATATDPANALELTNGHLKLSGTAPNADEAMSNTLTPRNIINAKAKITTDGAGNVSVAASAFNIASVAITTFGATQVVRVTFAEEFADTDYVVTFGPVGNAIGSGGFVPYSVNQTTATVDIRVLSETGSAQILSTTAVTVHMMSSGDQ